MSKMTLRKLRSEVSKANRKVNRFIFRATDQNNVYSRGLSREGYWGGYAQALVDVVSMMDGNTLNWPNTAQFWSDDEE